ncbi:MAG: cytochrome c biogenesis CcdA family protein [Gammaproteobacteria bacterium]
MMTLELASVPLAFLAGILSIMSPCVWPLVPIVMSSAASSGRSGPVFLALGLSTAFAVSGTVLTLLLLNLGLNPDGFRYIAAAMLLLVAAILLVKRLGDWAALALSGLTSRFDTGGGGSGRAAGQFGVGALLGLVWLPCVGPTLGAAIALASLGQQMGTAFVVMFAFGLGTAAALLAAGLVSGRLLSRWRPGMLEGAARGKQMLGVLLLALGLMVFTGFDKTLETLALELLPDWAISM